MIYVMHTRKHKVRLKDAFKDTPLCHPHHSRCAVVACQFHSFKGNQKVKSERAPFEENNEVNAPCRFAILQSNFNPQKQTSMKQCNENKQQKTVEECPLCKLTVSMQLNHSRKQRNETMNDGAFDTISIALCGNQGTNFNDKFTHFLQKN